MEITLTKDNFDETVSNAKVPVLVDFWASWCQPCMMLGPVVAQIAEENEGKVIVGKVNVDEEEELAQRFGIVSIPTVMVFEPGKNQEPAKMSVGFVPKERLESLFK